MTRNSNWGNVNTAWYLLNELQAELGDVKRLTKGPDWNDEKREEALVILRGIHATLLQTGQLIYEASESNQEGET